jgi:ribonuclease P protein component
VLPRVNRMHRSGDFRRAVRTGVRATSSTLVVHAGAARSAPGPVLVGFVVSKAVGNAVVRNQVRRRLRHAVRPRLGGLSSELVVIRAKPAAAGADYARLVRDLDRCLSSVTGVRC